MYIYWEFTKPYLFTMFLITEKIILNLLRTFFFKF